MLSIAIPQLGLEQAYLKGSKAGSTLIQQAPELKKVWKSSALRKEMNNAIKEIKTQNDFLYKARCVLQGKGFEYEVKSIKELPSSGQESFARYEKHNWNGPPWDKRAS